MPSALPPLLPLLCCCCCCCCCCCPSSAAAAAAAAPPLLLLLPLLLLQVGLPGRGKTFVCNKLKCYLNWLGHPTAHFNVGQYRRKIKEEDSIQVSKAWA